MSNLEKNRRLQLRKAQTNFRARKQEAQKAQNERLTNIEATIDEMVPEFLEFSSYIINSEACKRDGGVLQMLAAITRRVLALSRVTHNDSPHISMGMSTVVNIINQGPEIAEMADNQLSVTSWPQDLPASLYLLPDPSPTSSQTQSQWPVDHMGADSRDYPPTMPRNYLGNGWLGRLPNLITEPKIGTKEIPKFDQHSFAFRLLHQTLQAAYWSLNSNTEAYSAISNRMFRFSLLHHSKEDLLFNLRWFLGPGLDQSGLLMNGSLGMNNELAGNSSILSPSDDFVASNGYELNTERFPSDILGNYLSISEIDEYFQQMGARSIDFDTIEICVPLSKFQKSVEIAFPSAESYSGKQSLAPKQKKE